VTLNIERLYIFSKKYILDICSEGLNFEIPEIFSDDPL
jgi:hypothetical protein